MLKISETSVLSVATNYIHYAYFVQEFNVTKATTVMKNATVILKIKYSNSNIVFYQRLVCIRTS